MCSRSWQCMAVSIYYRPIWRSSLCTALSGFPDTAGITDYGDGILRGTCLPALRSEVLRFAGAGRNQVASYKVCLYGRQLSADDVLYNSRWMDDQLLFENGKWYLWGSANRAGGWSFLQYACQSGTKSVLDDCNYGYRLLYLQQRSSKRCGKDVQIYDVLSVYRHARACDSGSYPAKRCWRLKILSDSGFSENDGKRLMGRHIRSHGTGVFHSESWNRCSGNLWKLYRKRPLFAGWES